MKAVEHLSNERAYGCTPTIIERGVTQLIYDTFLRASENCAPKLKSGEKLWW